MRDNYSYSLLQTGFLKTQLFLTFRTDGRASSGKPIEWACTWKCSRSNYPLPAKLRAGPVQGSLQSGHVHGNVLEVTIPYLHN